MDKYPEPDAGDLQWTRLSVLCSRRAINRLIRVLTREHKIFDLESIVKVMDPLSNLWGILENLRSASRESHELDNVGIYICVLCLSRLFDYLDKLVWQKITIHE